MVKYNGMDQSSCYKILYLVKLYCYQLSNCWNLKQLSNRIVYKGINNQSSISPYSTGFVNPNFISGNVPDHDDSLVDDLSEVWGSIYWCHSKAAVNKQNRKDNNYHHGMQYLYIKVSININLFRRAVLISSIRGWVWVARLNYWASTCSSWLRPAPPPPLRGPHQPPVARS